jgi:hypothetical protein
MPNELELREREVRVQEQEQTLREKQFELDQRKGPWSNAAVSITAIAGVAAIIFQALNYGAAREDRTTAAYQLSAAKVQANRDWEFKGLQLFLSDEEKLVGCDPKATDAHVSLFGNFWPDLLAQFRTAAAARAQSCANAVANAAVTSAGSGTSSPQSGGNAADKARYQTISSFAPAVTQAGAPGQIRTVYLQIASEGQRSQALTLQQALISQGYSVPGIERVAAAPSQAQLRIYRGDEQNAARSLAAVIANALHAPPPAIQSLQSTYANLPAGVVEFWFPQPKASAE